MGELVLVPSASRALAVPAAITPAWRMALERLRGAYADRTIHETASAFRSFERWCARHDRQALPASAETLAHYLDEEFRRFAARTLQVYLHHIRRVHILAGFPDPTQSQEVRLAYRRGLRLKGPRVRQALGLNAELRDQLIEACDDSLIGKRDRALLAVGYDTLCRRSELVRLRLQDISPPAQGSAKVFIPASKTDPYSEGRLAYVSSIGLWYAQDWIRSAGLADGYLFRPILHGAVGAAALDAKIVNRRIKIAATRAGLAPHIVEQLSGHSLRVGAAQDLAIAGRSLLQIMRAGRWRDPRVVAHYVREADVNIWAQQCASVPRLLGAADESI